MQNPMAMCRKAADQLCLSMAMMTVILRRISQVMDSPTSWTRICLLVGPDDIKIICPYGLKISLNNQSNLEIS